MNGEIVPSDFRRVCARAEALVLITSRQTEPAGVYVGDSLQKSTLIELQIVVP